MNSIYSFEPLTAKQVSYIESLPNCKVCLLDRHNYIEECRNHRDMEILVCRDRDNILDVLNECRKLKFIFIVSTGVEKLPFKTLRDRSVIVSNTGGVNCRIMSEYAIGAVLAHSTRVYENMLNQSKHYWKKYQCVDSVEGKVLLLVGAGRTGKLISKIGRILGMECRGIKRDISKGSENFDHISTLEDLDEELSIADYVVCTLPLTDATRNLFDINRFQKMKKEAIFINISRGKLVVQGDLVKALRRGIIAGAILDVYEKEPLCPDDDLWDVPNLHLTPHSSGRLEDFMDRAIECCALNLSAYLGGKTIPNLIDLENEY